MEFPFEALVETEAETMEIAEKFADEISPGNSIFLIGNLGAGKTFFIKAVCSCLGIDDIKSPTFAIVHQHEGEIPVNHFDFYRIKKVEELYDIGFEEYLSDDISINFIEWADLFPEIVKKISFKIFINLIDSNKRKIKIEKYD